MSTHDPISDLITRIRNAQMRAKPGVETLGLARICALRMRVMRSLIGSCVDI